MRLFIPGSVPSSKNSKQWTGKFLVWSKSAQKYKKQTKNEWGGLAELFTDYISDNDIKPPYIVSFEFVRGSKHKFDYVNPLQTVLDLMVENEWIEDDNADIILPVFKPYSYDKNNAGVYIEIL